MYINAIVLVIATLGIMFWLFRRRPYPTIPRQDSETKGNQGEDKDELGDSEAAEVVATWNLLNPP